MSQDIVWVQMWGEKRFLKLRSRQKRVLNHVLKLNYNTSTQNCNLLFWQIMGKNRWIITASVREKRHLHSRYGVPRFFVPGESTESGGSRPSPGSCCSPYSSSTVWNKLSIQIEASTLYHRFQPQISKVYQSAMNRDARIQRRSRHGRAGQRGWRWDLGWSRGLGLEGESILEAIVSTTRPGATGIPRPGRCRRRPV
jgi:hypothetical protein